TWPWPAEAAASRSATSTQRRATRSRLGIAARAAMKVPSHGAPVTAVSTPGSGSTPLAASPGPSSLTVGPSRNRGEVQQILARGRQQVDQQFLGLGNRLRAHGQ